MASVWGELIRRNVVKVAVAYAIVGWLLIEVTSTVFPLVQLPDWTATFVAMLILVGFPIALILSWAYELTPDGMERTKSAPLSESIAKVAGRKLDFVIIGVLAIAVAFFAVDRFVLNTAGPFAGADIDPASLNSALDEAPPTVATEVEPAPPPIEEEQREVLPNSVAVLLCDNLSPDPDDAYFALSIHEEILNQLVKIRALNVIARTSVMQYADAPPPIPQIAAELNVGAVMECSVRFAGNAILVTAQLIDPETNSHLWSDTYPGDLSDLSTVFAMQADIAMNIANAVGAEFSLAEQESIESVPTDSPAAYALYLRALRVPAGLGATIRAVRDLDAAIELDPEFASAYALRAWHYAEDLLFSVEVPVAEWERNAIASAEQALALDPAIGLAHGALAAIDDVNWRWAEARRRAELAYRLSPNDSNVLLQYVRFTRSAGEYAESIRANERWAQLDPTSAVLYQQLAVTQRYARDYDAGAAAAQKAIELDPANPSYYLHLAYAEAARGNHDEALRELRIAEQLFGGNFDQVFRVGQMAMIYSQVGRREDAERMLALLEELDGESPVGGAIWALAYIALENFDEALRQLEVAMENPAAVNNTTLSEIKANP
ncbi:MAG: hypothetical protein V3T47_09645, partial [Gammaproteobacteria bacterium]